MEFLPRGAFISLSPAQSSTEFLPGWDISWRPATLLMKSKAAHSILAVGDAHTQSHCQWNRRSWQQSEQGELRLCLSLQSLMRPLGCMCVQLRSERAEGTHILLPTLRLWACTEVMWRVQQKVKARENLKNLKTIWTLIAFPYLPHIY